MFKIRPAMEADISSVVNLLEQNDMLQFESVDGPIPLRKVITNQSAVWLVAETSSGSVIGSIRGCWDGSRALIHQMVVDSEYRNLGIGKTLIKEISGIFKGLGAPTVAVTAKSNTIPFFEKNGFLDIKISLLILNLEGHEE